MWCGVCAAWMSRPMTTSSDCTTCKCCKARDNTLAPTLAPQPPHSGLSPNVSANPRTAGKGSSGAGIAG